MIRCALMDAGHKIGIGLSINGWRRAWRFRSPAWFIINWRWQRKHRAQ
jgi:hypothetical protein